MSSYSDSSYDPKNPNNSWYKALHLIPKGSKILDIGCSSGHFGRVLIKERNCIVDGIELDKADAKLAQKSLRAVRVLNIETDPISDIKDTYDVIYFGDVIEHLVDPVAALKKIKVLLNSNGKVIFSVPNMAHVTVRLEMLNGKFEYTETGLLDKTHLHFYTQEELQRIFTEAGYTIEKLEFVEKDYPNELIEDYVNKLGLQGSQKFYDLMRQPAAAAFQFVGSAVAGTSKEVKRNKFGPIDLFESYFNNTVTPLKNKIKELETQVSTLSLKNKELEDRFSNLKHHPIKTVTKSISRKVHHK